MNIISYKGPNFPVKPLTIKHKVGKSHGNVVFMFALSIKLHLLIPHTSLIYLWLNCRMFFFVHGLRNVDFVLHIRTIFNHSQRGQEKQLHMGILF